MKRFAFLIIIFTFSTHIFAQAVERICPPNWWAGMRDSSLQLMVHGDHIADFQVNINAPGITLLSVAKVQNPNYLFIDLIMSKDMQPQTIQIRFTKGKTVVSQPYEFKQRQPWTAAYGLDSHDFIYLLMPDRFSNGDTSNDSIGGMREKYYGRTSLTARHGGDIQGIINHLDYIKDLGFTAIWCTPLVENDQEEWSYHGYAVTDHYAVDKRYGNNDLYKKMVDASHERNMKVVLDIVPNHVGLEHWFIRDMPFPDWVHQWSTFTRTNYRTPALVDPYASSYDKNQMEAGWFDTHMPDLNESNAYVANFLTQNYIWWIEFAHVDAFRIDTYTYNDLHFMTQMQQRVFREYPGFYMFGETWVDGVGVESYFKGDNNLNTGYNSGLTGVTDFELLWSMNDLVQKPFGWTAGVANIYLKLAQDYLHGDANKNVVFFGNHDLSRFLSICGEDVNKMKLATAFILTTRGIPQWYYGDEILMKNFTNPDGRVREDFPGGWAGDSVNKFIPANLTGAEKDYFNYVKTLSLYRKNSKPITEGRLMQFVPYDGVYVYFRYTEKEQVMVIMNTSDKAVDLKTANYAERLQGYSKAKSVISGTAISDLSQIHVNAMSAEVLELH